MRLYNSAALFTRHVHSINRHSRGCNGIKTVYISTLSIYNHIQNCRPVPGGVPAGIAGV